MQLQCDRYDEKSRVLIQNKSIYYFLLIKLKEVLNK